VITIGIDPHKHSHTAVALDDATGELLGTTTVATDQDGHTRLIDWARELSGERRFAVEDCRHVSGRLERELIARGERVVRVPPKLMAGARRSAREFGKSDPIDAAAVARAALREPGLPAAHLDPRAREIRLLCDHREDLVAERTAQIQRLRWHLHDVDAGLEPAARTLNRAPTRRSLAQRLARREQTIQVRICRELLARISELTRTERELAREIRVLVRAYAPELLELPGCAELTAAKLIGEIAGPKRFQSDAQLARHSGCAPIEASSGRTARHRLSRQGNRQLNCAFHRIAVTQARVDPEARAYLERKRSEGKSSREALRCLKRQIVRRAFTLLRARDRELPISISPKMQEMNASPPAMALT
jgi:transposase